METDDVLILLKDVAEEVINPRFRALAAALGGQHVIASTELGVGVMSGGFCGLYLAWLLSLEWRAGRA